MINLFSFIDRTKLYKLKENPNLLLIFLLSYLWLDLIFTWESPLLMSVGLHLIYLEVILSYQKNPNILPKLMATNSQNKNLILSA